MKLLAHTALAASFLTPLPALANGQVSHLWISERAVDLLPPGDLSDLLHDPAYEDMWRNGSMFPDGGYAVGDGYGELAHWEPFQLAYTAWIRDTWGPPPYQGEAAEHVAFLMGMASHGMADQVYDAFYMQRAHQEDAASDWSNSMDEATDAAMASMVGPMAYGELWVPEEQMAALMRDAMGHEVDPDDIRLGQVMVRLVPEWGARILEHPEQIEAYRAQFPWACAHQLDPFVLGNPPDEAEVVARYWQEIEGRLAGRDLTLGPVLATFPPDGKIGWETDATLVTARVGTVLAWGMQAEPAKTLPLTITAEDGTAATVERWMFYGQNSHVLLAEPAEDWAETTSYTVQVPADLPFAGASLEAPGSSDPYAYGFTTGPVPLTGCSTTAATPRAPWLALLGLLGLLTRHGRRLVGSPTRPDNT